MDGQCPAWIGFFGSAKWRPLCRRQRLVIFPALLLSILAVSLTCGESTQPPVATSAEHDIPPQNIKIEHPAKPQSTINDEALISNVADTKSRVNIQLATPEGWGAPVIVSGNPDVRINSAIDSTKDVYISWAIQNQGPFDVNSPFFVDLYLDGVPVERWVASELKRRSAHSVEAWSYLPKRASLSAGPHTLMLVIDPTNLVLEKDEFDNKHATIFEWPTVPQIPKRKTVAPRRLPNLAPFIPEGWISPIRIKAPQSHIFSVPSIQVAYQNSGLSSIGGFFQTHLYIDGILAAKFGERGLISQELVITPQWHDLSKVMALKTGVHTFELKVDPTGLVHEVNENDNTFTMEFFWDPDSYADQSTDTDQARTLEPPNLVAFTPPSWGGPIVATNTAGQLASYSRLLIGSPTYIHWAIRNTGEQDLSEPYTIELTLSGDTLGAWHRDGLGAGQIDFLLDWPLPKEVQTLGDHKLELRIARDPLQASDHPTSTLAQTTLQWVHTNALHSDPISYTDEDLRKRFALLEELLSTAAFDVGATPKHSASMILEIIDAVYYSIYGTSVFDEPLTIHFLGDEEYSQWVAVECQDTLTRIPADEQPQYQQRCAKLDGFSAYTTTWRGSHRIVIRSARPTIQLLSTMAHEIGHFRQILANPQLGNGNGANSLDTLALREAQAYVYQVYFLRVLEGLTGRGLLLYPKLEGYERFIKQKLDGLILEADSSAHSRGQLLVWLALLTDPELRRTRTVLFNNRALTADAANEFFMRLVSIRPHEIPEYVNKLMANRRTQFPAIQSLALARLVQGLPYWSEGSPYLREVGLILP